MFLGSFALLASCFVNCPSLASGDTVPAAHLTGGQGYIRLAQDGILLEAGKLYLSSIRVKGNVRSGIGDHIGALFNEPNVEYSNYWYTNDGGWTIINRLVRPTQTKEYDFRVSLWSTRSLTIESAELTAADDQAENLLANGSFESGIPPWFAHGGQIALSQEAPGGSELQSGQPVTYTRFDGNQESLRAFPGMRVMLLIPNNEIYPVEDEVVESILNRLDSSWALFERFTGFHPASFADRVAEAPVTMPTLAVVESTCGAGCGMVGALGIEIGQGVWEQTYENAVQGLETRGVFEYEMGRNFWAFESRLETEDEPAYHMANAFATVMGYLAGVAAGSTTEPGNELVDWVQSFRNGYQDYSDDPNFDILLRGGIDAARVHGGLWLHLMESETQFYFPRYFRALLSLDAASSLSEAVANHVIASSVGAAENLTTYFQLLDFPVPAGTSTEIDVALANQSTLELSSDISLNVIDGQISEINPAGYSTHPWGDAIPIRVSALDEVEFANTQVPPHSVGILLEPEAFPVNSVPIPFLVFDPFGNFDQANIFLSVIDPVFRDGFEEL